MLALCGDLVFISPTSGKLNNISTKWAKHKIIGSISSISQYHNCSKLLTSVIHPAAVACLCPPPHLQCDAEVKWEIQCHFVAWSDCQVVKRTVRLWTTQSIFFKVRLILLTLACCLQKVKAKLSSKIKPFSLSFKFGVIARVCHLLLNDKVMSQKRRDPSPLWRSSGLYFDSGECYRNLLILKMHEYGNATFL